MKILVTGKAGVGKTTLLEKYPHYSVDKYSKDVWIKKGQKYYEFIKNNFGSQYVNNEEINTAELGKLLFANQKYLDKVNAFVAPIIKNWIKSLPHDSIIEFAQYMNNEKLYAGLFDKVILIQNMNPQLKNKFTYLKKEFQPIDSNSIRYDFVVDNTDFTGSTKFDEVIKKLENKTA